MRTCLWTLMIGVLTPAVGCLLDPAPKQHGLKLPTEPPNTAKDQRNQYLLSVRKAGGNIVLDDKESDMGVITADFNHIHLTGYAWEVLGPWKKVRELNLYDTGLTDAGMERLRKMPELVVLNLNDNKITDAGLACLQKLRHLRSLYLNQTGVTDAGLADLRCLPDLRNLELLDTQVTDAGLIHLLAHKNLEKLTLGGPAITDHSMEVFKSLRTLHVLTLVKSGVSASGIEELHAALPRLTVVADAH
jgi:Leucine-rich repeat (LRR) protein